jgi:hypothetical protein
MNSRVDMTSTSPQTSLAERQTIWKDFEGRAGKWRVYLTFIRKDGGLTNAVAFQLEEAAVIRQKDQNWFKRHTRDNLIANGWVCGKVGDSPELLAHLSQPKPSSAQPHV